MTPLSEVDANLCSAALRFPDFQWVDGMLAHFWLEGPDEAYALRLSDETREQFRGVLEGEYYGEPVEILGIDLRDPATGGCFLTLLPEGVSARRSGQQYFVTHEQEPAWNTGSGSSLGLACMDFYDQNSFWYAE